jgi:hypothetical protein
VPYDAVDLKGSGPIFLQLEEVSIMVGKPTKKAGKHKDEKMKLMGGEVGPGTTSPGGGKKEPKEPTPKPEKEPGSDPGGVRG